MDKQITRVMDAVVAGCETSDQCAAYTGLSLPTCSAKLFELAESGLIRRTHIDALHSTNSNAGRRMHRYSTIPRAA